jgi:hypothetical protein
VKLDLGHLVHVGGSVAVGKEVDALVRRAAPRKAGHPLGLNVSASHHNVGDREERQLPGALELAEVVPGEHEHRQAGRTDPLGERRERARLHEWLAPGECHPLDALGREDDGRQVFDRTKVTTLERPGVGVPASSACEGTALHPKDEPLAGAVRRAAREGAGEVEAHGQ